MAQPMTAADEEAAANPITEPIPTDEAGLYAFIRNTPGFKRWLIAAHIKRQTGRDLTDLVDRIHDQVGRDEDIDAARAELRSLLGAARVALNAVMQKYGELTGHLYDVEYAEGGDLFPHYLRKADRAIRTAIVVNPVPDNSPS